jgi:hypothetical protein
MLTVVVGLEWTAPRGGVAQSNPEPASTPPASVGNQDLPPIQEAAVTEEPKPFYKKWWFWTIVVVVAVVVAGVVVSNNSEDSEGCNTTLCGPPGFF